MSTIHTKASIITTERNEKESIAEFIESALAQSLHPDEIVIADGGSTDGTIEIIKSYSKKYPFIRLVNAPGNRSIGRNAATRAARNQIIAVTDVGSRLDKNWLKNITEPFRKNTKAMVVAGFFLPEPKTYFEQVSSTLMLNPNDTIDLTTWLPSSRSIAYKKTAWAAVDGYPEHTNFNEDTPFDKALRAKGFKFEDGLRAVVYWRPRPNLKEFYRQYYFYAVGDGLDNSEPGRIVKLTVWYIGLTIIFGLLLFIEPVYCLLVPVYFVTRQLKRTYPAWRKMGSIRTWLLMVLVITTYDSSQIVGYWHGLLRRSKLRHSQKLVR